MAGRYPDYDWRGIAMLTQQLGQLFEPNKAKMMSRQQEHEMNMLMAKQAWDMQSKQLTALETEYEDLTTSLATETEAVNNLGLRDLVRAGMGDGSNVEETSVIYDKLDVKKLSDMQEVASKYQEMIRDKKTNLSNMKLYNEEAKIGQEWRKGSMTKKDQKGVMVDYYEDSDKDGIAGLSYEEGQSAIKKYITDNYTVAEGEQGMEMNFGSGDDVETIMVRPEAIAFKAGWDSGTGTGTGRGKAETSQIAASKPGMESTEKMNQWFNLDAAWMNLPDEDKDKVINYLESKLPESRKPKLPLDLQDAMLQKKEMDQLSKDIGKAGYNDRIQKLDDSYWGAPAQPEVDRFDFGTGVRDIPAVPAGVKPWEDVGLDKQMYTNLRRMGSKAGVTRGALEHLIKNWDNMNDVDRSLAVAQIQGEYNTLIGL